MEGDPQESLIGQGITRLSVMPSGRGCEVWFWVPVRCDHRHLLPLPHPAIPHAGGWRLQAAAIGRRTAVMPGTRNGKRIE